RLDQVVPPGGAAGEAALDQALSPLGHALAVGDDGTADAEHRVVPLVLAGGEADRADRDVESRVAIGVYSPDAAAIGPARIALDLLDQLHRPNLWRAGDRAAGKQRLDHLGRAASFLQLRRDRRGHGVQGWTGFDGERPPDPHRP